MNEINRTGVKPPHGLTDAAFIEWLETLPGTVRMQKMHRDRAYMLARHPAPIGFKGSKRKSWRQLAMLPKLLAARAKAHMAEEVAKKILA